MGQLRKLIGVMKDVQRVEKINTRKASRIRSRSSPVQVWRDYRAIARLKKTEAKLAGLLEQKGKEGGDYQGLFSVQDWIVYLYIYGIRHIKKLVCCKQ